MPVKLTLRQAREIRDYRKAGQSIATLANTYQVSTTTIWEIIRGTRFRESDAPPVHTGAPLYHPSPSMREAIAQADGTPPEGTFGRDDEAIIAQILKNARKGLTGA